ncbi:type I-E CRISPR-associated protein Cas5/CasD [Streptomyces lavendulae]|uniref:type I-E CRISPR-associated protein Cas5/CasD n=1 Tax=Streptomyces lavendulae TaxID=1914 RepID=UPI00382D69D1
MTSSTLILRLAAPMQAWGDQRAVLHTRHTSPHPTKSGVIGMLAAAYGHRPEDPLDALAELKFGVRCDVPGTLLEDYQVASDYRGGPLPSSDFRGSGRQKPSTRVLQPGRRYYLQDAAFLAAVQGPTDLVEDLAAAVRAPACLIGLGRRSCPPTMPILLDTTPTPLVEVLTTHPWIASDQARTVWQRHHRGAAPASVEVAAYIDDHAGSLEFMDQPVSYHPVRRQHAARRVAHRLISVPTGFTPDPDQPDDLADQGHDPLALLGW